MLLLCCKQFHASLDESVWLEMLSCCWKQFYASLDRSVWQLKLLCSWERLYTSLDRSVREETLSRSWKLFYANKDRSDQQEMVFCSWNQIFATDCWQELHFEFSRQDLNWNVQSPSMWWWLITQPRPIWKKAPPGLQRPSHTDSPIPWVLYWPKLSVPPLGPDPRCPQVLKPRYDPVIN